MLSLTKAGNKRVRALFCESAKAISGKNCNVSSAAGARELACFVWGMMNGKIA